MTLIGMTHMLKSKAFFQRNTYTWGLGANHWEIQLTELEEK